MVPMVALFVVALIVGLLIVLGCQDRKSRRAMGDDYRPGQGVSGVHGHAHQMHVTTQPNGVTGAGTGRF